MFQWLKNRLKRVFPPPVYVFNREVERILMAVEQTRVENRQALAECQRLLAVQVSRLDVLKKQAVDLGKLVATLEKQAVALEKQTVALEKQTAVLEKQAATLENQDALAKQLSRETAQTRKQLETALEAQKKSIDTLQQLKSGVTDVSCHALEAVWAEIFNNTIAQSHWLKDKTFSPGRWAVGYPYLYAMYRVLNNIRPKRILELGLGQSTRMIAQYAATFDDVEHIVVEHDPAWIEFFRRDFALSERTELVRLDLDMIPFRDAETVRIYKGFQERFAGQQFDFISIDAPLGGDLKQYARIDVLGLLPGCLGEDWVIMIDDCNRQTEQHTVEEMKKRLWDSGITYQQGIYQGEKCFILLAPEHLGFLTSM